MTRLRKGTDLAIFENNVDSHVGARIKHRRIVLGLTRQQLADSVNLSLQQIHKYETNVNRVSASKLYNIALILKVPVNYFYEMLEDKGIVSSSSVAEQLEMNNSVSEREVIDLVKCYTNIKSPKSREKVKSLLVMLSETLTNNL